MFYGKGRKKTGIFQNPAEANRDYELRDLAQGKTEAQIQVQFGIWSQKAHGVWTEHLGSCPVALRQSNFKALISSHLGHNDPLHTRVPLPGWGLHPPLAHCFYVLGNNVYKEPVQKPNGEKYSEASLKRVGHSGTDFRNCDHVPQEQKKFFFKWGGRDREREKITEGKKTPPILSPYDDERTKSPGTQGHDPESPPLKGLIWAGRAAFCKTALVQQKTGKSSSSQQGTENSEQKSRTGVRKTAVGGGRRRKLPVTTTGLLFFCDMP